MVSKTDIIKEVTAQVPRGENAVKAVIDAFWKSVTETVEKGEELRFIGLGKFYKNHRAARTGRNPQTGEPIQIKESNKLAFKGSLSFDD